MTEDEGARRAGAPGAAAPSLATAGPDLRTALLAIVTLILLGWALRAMAVVLVPLVASILIALAVMPVRDAVRARVPARLGGLGGGLGVAAAMTVILLVLALFFGGIWLAAQQLVGQLPDPSGTIAEMLQGDTGASSEEGAGGEGASLAQGAEAGADAANGPAAGGAAEPAEEAGGRDGQTAGGGLGGLVPGSTGETLRRLGERAAGAAAGVAATVLNSALALVAGLVLIFFLTLLILIESGEWRRKLGEVARPITEWRLLESADVIAGKVRRYLLVQSALGLATALLYAVWLWFFDVGLILVWSLLTLLLVFIPTVGSLVAGTLPVIYTLLTQGLGPAVIVGAGILVIEQIMGNFAEPHFQGRNIALSPLVILGSLTFWVWTWGLAGALLAVPVTVALVVLASHAPLLRPWALLLSDQTDMEGLDEATRT